MHTPLDVSSHSQPKPAVEALCQARSFALWFNKEDTAKRVTGTLVYALAQFGLPLRIPPMPSERRPQPAWELPTCKEREENDRTEESSDSAPTSEEYAEEECGSKPWESDGKLSADDLWALEQLGLTKDCHILQLISLAFHYLRSKQVTVEKHSNCTTAILTTKLSLLSLSESFCCCFYFYSTTAVTRTTTTTILKYC